MLCILGHAENSIDVLVVDLWDLVSRHVLNVEVVFEERVSFHSGFVGDVESISELSWVLLVEEDVDSVKSALLFGVFPIALVSLRLEEVLLDLELSPEAEAVLILPETSGGDLGSYESWLGLGVLILSKVG